MAKTILVSGGAGFLGANLCEALVERGDTVVCADNLITGRVQNINGLKNKPNFSFIECDITLTLPKQIAEIKYDAIANLASIGSPPKYFKFATETLMSGSVGTKNMLDLALRDNARFMHTSTSEVYGDPAVHPQTETYWGNVNPYGARSMYDESKRFAEALIWVYRRQKDLNTGVVRIFNTYGPKMDPNDGRVVSNFVIQALKGQPLTIYGEGQQTRSFCYVSDQINGLINMLDSDVEGPINIGNPGEFTMLELAKEVLNQTKSNSRLVHKPLPADDPAKRQPDITLAKQLLGWKPKVSLPEGLKPTIAYFRSAI